MLSRSTGKSESSPTRPAGQPTGALFLFFYFLISFFTKIYFRSRNLQKYTRPPRFRAAGAFLQKFSRKICVRASEGQAGRGAAGPGRPARRGERTGGPRAARLRSCSLAASRAGARHACAAARQRGCAGRQDCRARLAPPAAEEDRTCRCYTGAEAEGHDHRPPPRYELIFIFNFYFPISRIQFLFQ